MHRKEKSCLRTKNGGLKTAVLLIISMRSMIVLADTTPVAFIQPDATTHAIPTDAFEIERGGKQQVADKAMLQPCDVVRFKPENGVRQVMITTVQGGKNIRLDQALPETKIPCDSTPVSNPFLSVWREISDGDRTAYSVAAVSRGDEFKVPILSSDRSNLIAVDQRSLYISWVGGVAPYRVQLRRADTGQVISEINGIRDTEVRMPALSLPIGQYSLSVFDTPTDASAPERREDNLFVVDPSSLPSLPVARDLSQLSEAERQLLYVYFLEGTEHGRWAFEAMQRAVAITPTTAASTAWLDQYGGRVKR